MTSGHSPLVESCFIATRWLLQPSTKVCFRVSPKLGSGKAMQVYIELAIFRNKERLVTISIIKFSPWSSGKQGIAVWPRVWQAISSRLAYSMHKKFRWDTPLAYNVTVSNAWVVIDDLRASDPSEWRFLLWITYAWTVSDSCWDLRYDGDGDRDFPSGTDLFRATCSVEKQTGLLNSDVYDLASQSVTRCPKPV